MVEDCGLKAPLMPGSDRRKPEAVVQPAHYGGDDAYEVFKVLCAWGLGANFWLGNTIKYVARAGKKDSAKLLEDLKKARYYLDYQIQLIEQAEKMPHQQISQLWQDKQRLLQLGTNKT